MEEERFFVWLRHQRFTVILAVFCACIPFILEVVGKWPNWIPKDIQFNYVSNICNIIFVFGCLLILANSDFLLNKDRDDKSKRILMYVKKKFGGNSLMHLEGEKNLFKRMEKSFRQFYYSWITVWIIWLILYVEKFIYMLNLDNNSLSFSKNEYFFENTLNLINSFAMFFIYMVITISTVDKKTPANNLRQMYQFIIILSFLGACCILFDRYSLFIGLSNENLYYEYQFYIHLFIGVIASMSMMAVLGRLNSSYLNIPQWLIICLYFYAALQMLYPFTILGDWIDKFSNQYVYSTNDDSKKIENSLKMIEDGIYICAFLGKICLFLTIRWVMQKKRFLFYLINKAHCLEESDDMLIEFNRYYERCR